MMDTAERQRSCHAGLRISCPYGGVMQKVPAAKRNSATFAVICDLAPGYAILGPQVGWSCLKAPKAHPWSTARLVPKIGCLGDCRALAQWHKAVKILMAAGITPPYMEYGDFAAEMAQRLNL